MSQPNPGIIPVPTYLFDDDRLQELIALCEDVEASFTVEGIPPCARLAACAEAVKAELTKRGIAIILDPKTNTIHRGGI